MYKILSEQNFSIALTLILTILLSQSNIVNFLVDTILGKILLILILLCISYTNQQLGVASMLFVIMVFACSFNYTENFEAAIASETVIASEPVPESDELDAIDNTKYVINEGFDILGTEQTLQRGKKSNTIMVNEEMRKYDNVDPYGGESQFTSIS
jgi:hypothetical protein